ncbi:MAG: PAS domain S-box protein [Calditrichaeota bacterium]|nr:PAS domain S-box protein [Calditrichota bacterium]RQV99721.1 MAG: PAS domain S-box protein [Calditrichota bacterium]
MKSETTERQYKNNAVASGTLPDCLSWIYDSGSERFRFSGEASALFGQGGSQKAYSLDDILESIHPEDKKCFLKAFNHLLTDGKSFEQSVRFRKNSRAVINTRTSAEKISGSEDTSTILGTIILYNRTWSTERREVKQYNNQYRQLFELSPTGIIVEDKNGIILDVNPSFCHSIGYNREELAGQDIRILAHPEVRDQVSGNIAALMAGQVLKHTVKSIRKNGSSCFMELRETKVQLPGGDEGILCIAEDFTEKLKAQDEHVQKEKLKTALEMAGAVCHELNQPLTTIFITTDLLMDFPKNENVLDILSILKNEAMRISRLSERLRHIAKYETRDYIQGQKIFDINKASLPDEK